MRTIDTLRECRSAARSSCVALGFFDGVHRGHQAVIDAAVRTARAGGLTPAVFAFTLERAAPDAKRGAGRLMSGELFEQALAERGVELLFRPAFEEFKDLSPEQFVGEMLAEGMGAAALSCGYDYRFGRGAAGDCETLAALAGARGMSLDILPAVQVAGEVVSSSRIRELVRAGEMERARVLMGRRFAVDFEVIHGNRIGKSLGWPTINQPFPEDFVLPRFGVYAAIASVEGRRYSAVTNVGVKPTVGSDRVLAETYIQGFTGDLYDRRVLVEFVRFVRPERRFASLEALRAQISADAEEAAGICAGILRG